MAVAQNPHHARRRLILGVIAMAQVMVVLDAAVVNIALPSAQRAVGLGLFALVFGFSSAEARSWGHPLTIAMLAAGALLLAAFAAGALVVGATMRSVRLRPLVEPVMA